jgi:succinyl-diaminopimelate desuccinylase
MVAPQSGFAPILLMTHIDVVDAPDELFTPFEKDGKLYGRGSLDDKYAVALSLVLLNKYVKQLREHGKGQDNLPFGILITSDEEIGGFNGANKALQEIKTDFCIVLDGGNLDKIVVREKGSARLKLVSRVKAAQGSRPWLRENAIEQLIDDYVKLRTYFIRSVRQHWHRSINIRSIHAEKSHHQVPEYAEAELDVLYTETDNIEELINRMKQELNSMLMIEAVEPIFDEGPSLHLDLLLDISKNTSIGFQDGSNDAGFLTKYGIKGIIWGANGDQSQHSLTEHVDIESVYALYHILNEFIKNNPSSV